MARLLPMVRGRARRRAVDLRAIMERFDRAVPAPRVELAHDGAWQLLVATILSAQSTDKTINKVTPRLFARWRTPAALGAASQSEVEAVVRPTGFFRNKAKAIRGASRMVAERFGGEVPRTMEQMIELPGVARKTANVVLGAAYGIASGIVVDTHVGRVARRLGLTKEDDPVKVERDLCAVFARGTWVDTGNRLLLHGRYVCLARKPRCGRCPVNELCQSAGEPPVGGSDERAEQEQRVVASSGAIMDA